MKREAGFTLIEELVATAVMMIIAGSVYAALIDAINATEGVTLLTDTQENLRAEINYVMWDLAQAGEGIPQGGIPIPNSGGGTPVSAVNRPLPPGSAPPTLPTSWTVLPAISPGLPVGAVRYVCLVCDAARPVGIMGGSATEISFATKNVLLECAWFDPISIRRAAKNLKLHTEASTRFGRGADLEMAELASRRCAELIQQLAGGEIPSGVVDKYPRRLSPARLTLT
jgi:type II secretory pathway pseudopilin PulG